MRRKKNRNRVEIIAGLDIGTTKVSCCIARIDEQNRIEVIGVGHQQANGLRQGVIIDIESLRNSILNAVNSAEQMANQTIEGVLVNVPSSQHTSQRVRSEINIAGQGITDHDVQRVLTMAQNALVQKDREIIHSIPLGFSLDNNFGIKDPIGMFGHILGVDSHVISAPYNFVRNIVACINRCHLEVLNFVAAPIATALATLVEDEKELGVILIDIGGGTTTLAGYQNGDPIFSEYVPIGGLHITHDIARGLSTPIAHAERLKTLYGSALTSTMDDRETLKVLPIGEMDENNFTRIPKSYLINIIRARVEEIFECISRRLNQLGRRETLGKRIVLTGGGSQLAGIREYASTALNRQVRLGRPYAFQGDPKLLTDSSFTTCLGLLRFAYEQRFSEHTRFDKLSFMGGFFSRLSGWIRENV